MKAKKATNIRNGLRKQQRKIHCKIPSLPYQSILDKFQNALILEADRCTDRTIEKAQKYWVKTIRKPWKRWKSSLLAGEEHPSKTRAGDVRRSYTSINKVQRMMEYKPSIALKEGIRCFMNRS